MSALIETPEVDENRTIEDEVISSRNASVLPIANAYVATYLIVIVVAATASNSLVLTVMALRKRKLRTFQLCLISVCVSDLLFSLLLHPMSIATALGYDTEAIFSKSGCMYFGVMALFFGTYDMVMHSMIAVLRYVNLRYPARAESVSLQKITYLLLLCVCYSMSWCIGPVFGLGNYETFEVGCTIAFGDDSRSGRIFVNCAFIFVFFLPLLVTIYSYIAIVLEARKQRLLLQRLGNVTSVGKSRLNVELKLVRSTSAIAAAYIIAWFPYAIVCLNETYGDAEAIPWTFRILAALFCKTATATNPILYLFMSKGFRRETVQTLQILLKCKNPRIVSGILYNFSQKSSSHPSSSQISLRSSWQSKQRKDRSNVQKVVISGSSSGEQTHYLSNIAETRL